jgi:hypothetical protein
MRSHVEQGHRHGCVHDIAPLRLIERDPRDRADAFAADQVAGAHCGRICIG